MRIIAGTSGGIPIKVPQDTTRPTTDRVREAIFSSLGQAVVDATVLDLFAGSGSLGLESLSRGAGRVLFVDQSRIACDVISQNLKKTKLAEKAGVRCQRVLRFLSGVRDDAVFDLIFADPPYARNDELNSALTEFLSTEKLIAALADDGIFILESYARVPLPEVAALDPVKEKIYGDTRITYFHHT